MGKRLMGFGVVAFALLAGLMLAALAPTTAKADWVQSAEGDWYYQNADGSYVVNNWISYQGNYYFFGADGKMSTDTFVTKTVSQFGMELEKETYYVDAEGLPRTNYLLEKDGNYYYFGSDGIMLTNETITLDGNTYRFDSEGKCAVSNKTNSAYSKKVSQSYSAMSSLLITGLAVGSVLLLINPKTRGPFLAVLKVVFFVFTIAFVIIDFVSPRRRY